MALILAAVAIESSIAGTTPAVVEGPIAQARISAAAAKSMVAFSGCTRVAAGRPSMTEEIVCVAVDIYMYIADRVIAPHTAAAARLTSTQPRGAAIVTSSIL